MPNTVVPSRWKALLPSLTGSLCERMQKLFQYPGLRYEDHAYKFTEAGTITDAFGADICALGCVGGGGPPPNPNMPAPTNVMASDDSFTDKIRVTWDLVTPPTGVGAVTLYKVYRSASDNLDPNLATLIASVDAPTALYDDPVGADVSVGVNYIYWVKATNGTDESAFSIPNAGRAAAPTLDLPAISDLACSQGFASQISDGDPISLVFTPPAGASKYDVWRNTTNDFSTATKVIADIPPQNTQDHYISTQSPDQCWDNVDTIVIYHFPPLPTVHYFFWVVAKKTSPPAISPESNGAEGWVRSYYAPFLGNSFRLNRGETATEGSEFTGNQIRVILFGSGGGGAGGSQIYGGGGGGGGPVIIEEFAISPGDVVTLVSSPDQNDTGNAAALANGAAFTSLLLKINGVTKMSALGGHGGVFSSSGGGAGGAGSTGTGTTTPTIHPGHAGLPGVGAAGGGSGYHFGNKRYPAAWYNGFTGYDGNGTKAAPGGGSKSAPGTEVLAVGGFGQVGYAVIVSTVL